MLLNIVFEVCDKEKKEQEGIESQIRKKLKAKSNCPIRVATIFIQWCR